MSTSEPKQEVNFDLSVGFTSPDQPVSWNRRDLLLYAAGIGAGPEDLEYTYEALDSFRAFPTYPLVLSLKGEAQDTTIFSEMVSSRAGTPGFPVLDPNTIVHGEQSIEIIRPLPIVSGPGWKLRKRVCAVHDKGNALILETEIKLISPVGAVHAVMIAATFYRGGGQGTGYSRSIIRKPPGAGKPPACAPDLTLSEKTTPAQAVLYRLSGDYNPLHIDPQIGARGGLGGVILHGLCSYGHAARAVLRTVEPQDGKRGAPAAQLKMLNARFTSPVKPGDELETKVWKVGEKEGAIELLFEQTIVGGKKSLAGYAQVIPASAAQCGAKL
ncbi:hypothetical protein K437DRAFT_270392 [Tilletiaria anomala UBC 951]|uniref:Uncharacterized protein n=1 Tax=Tilletiaria anomala (strain ATCC 24038 / CBS 436.72 / UBC 951) TaxID=1037660 RepID=A0A066VKI0_TILAU|nr:uncharacterized protein K437DRAFT_270392 [Tilletiaria anomala UBC 951]KDN39085.1 hypothetical protein K437DRAFT_270392 [Tilletiaria anomala UBC 951]